MVAGTHDLILLEENLETLIGSVSAALGSSAVEKLEPGPRDEYLSVPTWGARTLRSEIRKTCPSFDRIVRRVAEPVRTSLGN